MFFGCGSLGDNDLPAGSKRLSTGIEPLLDDSEPLHAGTEPAPRSSQLALKPSLSFVTIIVLSGAATQLLLINHPLNIDKTIVSPREPMTM